MMKKKLLSLALALVMCLGLTVPAFAAEEENPDTAASAETSAEGKGDETPAEDEEKKDEAEDPAEGEEKEEAPEEGEASDEEKEDAEDPAEGEDEPAAAVNPFTDVAESSPFYQAILWAVDEEITNGTTPTTFGPGNTCSISNILTFLYRASGKPGAEEGVADRDSAAKWAVEQEMIEEGADVSAPCTRAMAVTFLWKAAGSPEAETDKEFTDVAADAEFAPAVAWAVENGVTSGTGDGTAFSPDNTCTRGQIVTFLYRANQAETAAE